jgi:indole-3-glycerol phosphate synthase
MTMSTTSLLGRILASKRAEIARLIAAPPPESHRRPGGLSFQTLRRPSGAPLRLIAEIKPRSPSAGVLSTAMTIAERARAYANAGAVMISVLVDEPFFGGSYENLAMCRDALEASYGASRPLLLCKEFILDPVQLDHAVAAGADAVLLIARIVTAEELGVLAEHARNRGLEPLVEVTTVDELAAAEAARARVIGVNARDLDTLTMDQVRAAGVLARIGANAVRVHLSGLATAEDVARITRGPADAALIGEALMRKDDPTELLSEMVRRSADKL